MEDEPKPAPPDDAGFIDRHTAAVRAIFARPEPDLAAYLDRLRAELGGAVRASEDDRDGLVLAKAKLIADAFEVAQAAELDQDQATRYMTAYFEALGLAPAAA